MKKLLVLLVMLVAMNASGQWVNYTLPYDGIVYSLGFTNVNTGVACGHTFFPFNAKLYYTTNGGNNWLASAYPSTLRAISKVQFINSSLVYAGGAENGPFSNFKNYNPGFKHLPSYIRNKLISKGITEMYSEYKTAFIKSTNAGVNWQKVSTFDTLTGYMNSFHFFDANTGYALIDSNSYGNTRFYKTTNAGVNWQLVKMVEAKSQLKDIYFSDLNTGYVSGINMVMPGGGGVIYKTTNGGINWVKTLLTRVSQIEDLTFINSTTGFAVGINGDGITSNPFLTKIYRTTNAGLQWDSIITIANHMIQNLESLPSTGTVFGVGNLLDSEMVATKLSTIKTTNYGADWVVKDLNQITFGVGLFLIDQNNFIMSGGDINSTPMIPRIFKSTNGGVWVNQIGTTVPSSYSLGQNYPNPFNPVTNVKFSIVKVGDVKLVVYDIQGREVQTLVNERLQTGTYETSFDGSALNSGVYFYKLMTDGFSETKKMLLIK